MNHYHKKTVFRSPAKQAVVMQTNKAYAVRVDTSGQPSRYSYFRSRELANIAAKAALES